MNEKLAQEKRFHRLLDELLEAPAAAREALLEARCGTDATLRRRLEGALAVEDEEALDLLRHPRSMARSAAAGPLDAGPLEEMFSGSAFLSGPVPRIVGPYVLYEILGQGGMGRVFRAEQMEPVRREVALKLMRSSVKTAETRRRFDGERRTLQRLEHPNIGRILDSGTTEDDHPYFAMELLTSDSITVYCDRHQLSLEARIGLVAQVCRGLEHAHGQRVLHRDLKPSNLLVVEVDGRPVPKIIDFGIATILDQGPDDAIAIRGLTGTPSYMSPEALAGLVPELEERSDVYSLGTVLYELMVGEPPIDSGGGDLSGAVCRIVAGEVEAPSRKARSLSPSRSAKVAQRRGLAADELPLRLEGEIDRILLMATARAAQDRFPSAAAFAAALDAFRAERRSEGVRRTCPEPQL